MFSQQFSTIPIQFQPCLNDDQCPYFYQCQNNQCHHVGIFPLGIGSILSYIFMGMAASICNVSGNSMGIFKVLILMIMLDYDFTQGTGLAQAMVVGTALPNIFAIVTKQHPNGITSLVNYRLLNVIIPCTLIGSTLGALINSLTPTIVQFVALLLVFGYFTKTFWQKLKKSRSKSDLQDSLLLSQGRTQVQGQLAQQGQGSQSIVKQSQGQKPHSLNDIPQQNAENQQDPQKTVLLKSQKSYHLSQIALTIGVFIVFEFLSILVQGKFPFYHIGKCQVWYALGLVFLIALTVGYLLVLKKYMNKVYSKYRQFNIPQEIQLDGKKAFLTIAIGGLSGGLIQGFIGMGCGTCLMMVMLMFPIDSTSAAATSGYQILFTGMGSLLQFYLNGSVQIFSVLWIMGVCCFLGGILTIFLRIYMSRLSKKLTDQIIFIIIISLCIMSSLLATQSVVRTVINKGWDEVLSIIFKC